MLLLLLLSAVAEPRDNRSHNTTAVEDPNDPAVIERNVRQSCSEAKNVEEAYLMMGLTTALAQTLIDTVLPISNAGLTAYPDTVFARYGERLSYNDREYILIQVAGINDRMLAAWNTLDRQIMISTTASNDLIKRPQHRLRGNERRAVAEACARDRLQIVLAIVVVNKASEQIVKDLDALDAEIAKRAAIRQ